MKARNYHQKSLPLIWGLMALLILMPLCLLAQEEQPAWLKDWQAPGPVADNYVTTGDIHKVMVERADPQQMEILSTIRPINTYTYQGSKLFLISSADWNKLSADDRNALSIRDDLNFIHLRNRRFDTFKRAGGSDDEGGGMVTLPPWMQKPEFTNNKRKLLYLIQYIGPVQEEWYQELTSIEGLQVVSHVPENAYLVFANKNGKEALLELMGQRYYTQWFGWYRTDDKIHPRLNLEVADTATVIVQMVNHNKVGDFISKVRTQASEVLREPYYVGSYVNMLIKIPANKIRTLADLDAIVNIEPFTEPTLHGERQAQIIAGNLNRAETGPGGPGYLDWLLGLDWEHTDIFDFYEDFNFVVDITDDGIDRGEITAAQTHPDFHDPAGNSRIAYSRCISGSTVSTANDENTGGHGTINASIAGGLNTTPVTDPDFAYFGDADGYHYGLGIAPFVRLGNSNRFCGTTPDYSLLIDSAYSDGARISNNSWGARWPSNQYDAVSEEYDYLVRDARRTTPALSGEPGNQEMVIVFAAGNSGAGAIGDRGAAAKNTVTVGASENSDATGDTDGSGIGPAGADNVHDIISFSSRGPTVDGRAKPDIMAPGTHVMGAASQDAGFDGSSVSGDTDNDRRLPPDDAYYPDDPDLTDGTDQDLYTWSSGTSQAAPAVAGAAAVLRLWFLDQGHPAPSPALTKAILMNSASHMTGALANDDLPSGNQGMGLTNLSMALDETPTLLFDQIKTCYQSEADDASETFTVDGSVADATQPFRVTLAYTDAPGDPVTGVIQRNDLDLEVEIGGNLYKGNMSFNDDQSQPVAAGSAADDLNNVESVFLPAGTTGNYTVTVRPRDINEDGVPNNLDDTDQDFALVIYNGTFPERDPVDIILALDRSGSMNSIAPDGTEPKIDVLKKAVEMFIRIWEPFSIPEDRMGVVLFNGDIDRFPAGSPATLPFQANANNIIEHVRDITATGCTSIGGGILTADEGFDNTPGHYQAIIAFTNGRQNTSPLVQEVSGALQIIDDAASSCDDPSRPGLAGVELVNYDAHAIHTIGTGVSGETWVDLLTDIAAQTGGTHHFTDEPDEELEDYFLETLVAALRSATVTTSMSVAGDMANSQDSQDEKAAMGAFVEKATFALSWPGSSNLSFELFAPDNTKIPRQKIAITTGDFYSIGTIEFPLVVDGKNILPEGEWSMRVKKASSAPAASYRARLFVEESDMRYYPQIPDHDFGAGEAVPITLAIQNGNQTLQGFEVVARIKRPATGYGTFLAKNPVSDQDMQTDIDLSGDQFSLAADKKSYLLYQQDALRSTLRPVSEEVILYDDGKPEHGDTKANDGVYSTIYRQTQFPGYYSVDLAARGEGFVYQTSEGFNVRSKVFDWDQSNMEMKCKTIRTAEGPRKSCEVAIRPIDKQGNYLGPGHQLGLRVSPSGKQWGKTGRSVAMKDKLDGSYSARVLLTEAEVQQEAKLLLEINGATATKVTPKAGGKFGLSLHGGYTNPVGSSSDDFEGGLHLMADLSYQFNPNFALMGMFGYNEFRSKDEDVIDDTYWLNASLNAKYQRNIAGPWKVFLHAGPGLYIPENGGSEFGANIGLAGDYEIQRWLDFELGVDYHRVFDSDVQFIQARGGLIFKF